MKTNNKFLQLKNCIPGVDESLVKRAVFDFGDVVNNALEKGGELLGKADALKEWNKINTDAKFDKNSSDTTLKELAQKAYLTEANQDKYEAEIRKALEEQTKDTAFQNLNGLWEYLKGTGIDTIKIVDGKFKFYAKTTEITIPNYSFKIEFQPVATKTKSTKGAETPNEAKIIQAETKESKLYTNEELKQKLGELNNGDTLKISRYDAGAIGTRKEYTVIYHDGNFFYKKGQKANIFKSDIITPPISKEKKEAPEKEKITVDQKNEDNAEYQLFKNHEIVGKFKLKVNQTPEKALHDAINPNEKEAFSNFPKIKKLRDLNLNYEAYQAFLTKEQAIRSDGTIYLLIPKEKDISGREDKNEKERAERRQEQTQKIAKGREAYFLTLNFSQDAAFKIKDPKLVEALGNDKEWAAAWDNGAIEGIRTLKGIITSEPLFAQIAKDPDKIRTALQTAITEGRNDKINISDILNILMKDTGVRMPSYSMPKTPEITQQLGQEKPFSGEYSQAENLVYSTSPKLLHARYLAMGFLTKLGAFDTAKTVEKYIEDGKGKMLVIFEFDNHVYRAKIAEDGKVNIYQYPTGADYPTQNGYSNEKSFNEAELTGGDKNPNSPKNTVAQWFKNAVTPLITYDNANAEFQKFYDGKEAKPNMYRGDILDFYKNLVIASNRLSSSLQDIKLDEATLQRNLLLSNRQERIEQSPENLKLNEYIQNVFPNEIGDRSWNDVLEQVGKKYNAQETLMHMNGSYANAKFKEMVEKAGGLKNGKLDQTIVFNQFRNLLQIGLSRLGILFPDEKERQQVEAELQGLLNINNHNPDGVYDVSAIPDYRLVGLLGHPQENQAIFKMIQKGLVLDLVQKEDLRKTKVNKEYADALANYYKFPEADRQNFENAIREHLKKQGLQGAELEKEVKTTVSKAIPIIPVVGYDANSKTLGLGVALNFPVELGENGKYGTLFLGGGTGLGIGLETGKVGAAVGTGVGYETAPIGHIGNVNFSIIGGASLGFGVSEEGLKLGGGAGLALGIDLGTDKVGYNHKVSVGIVATNFGLLPGVVYGYKKNHEYKMREALDDGLKAFGFTNIDLITDPQAKTKAIMGTPALRSAILQQDKTALNDQEKILNAYNNLRKDLVQTIQGNYNSTGFNGMSFGFGLTNEGKFVFGISPDFTLSDDRKSYFRSDKSTEQMESEIDREQLISILRKQDKDRSDEEKRTIIQAESIGYLALDTNGKPILTKEAKTKPLQTASAENIDSIKKMEDSLNALYGPLELIVKYDPTKKLFELLIPHDEKRNFELAVDPAMAKGGIVFEGGRVFLATDFKPEHPLTIKRSNFEYPFPKAAGASFVSIITISDQPNTPGMEIYRQAPKVLVSTRGEGWREEKGFQPSTTDRMLTDAAASEFKIDDSSFKKFEARKNSAQTEKNINIFKQTIGKIDESKYQDYVKFAQDFEKANKKDYRRLSNKETNSADYKELTDKINAAWATTHSGTKPNLAELNLIRGLLVDESFTELDKIKDPKARQAAFLDQLKRTRKTTEKRFKDVVERNQAKYPDGDPRRINRAPEALSTYALDRVKGVDINDPNGVNVKDVDRFLSMASTEGERGFRGTLYTKDEDQNKRLLGGMEYAKALQTPNTIEADMAKFVMESFSPMEAMAEDKGDFNNQEKVKKLLSNPLTLQITGLLENPATQGLFSKDEYRDIVIDIVANQKTALNTDEVKAAQELYQILEGIRKAQSEGKEAYLDPKHPDFRFVWKLETFDGVYKRCTNYSNWINEKLGLEIRTEQVGAFAGYAGQGTSVAEVSPTTQHNTLTFGFAAGIAGKPEGPKGEIIPPPPITPPGKKIPTNNPIVGDSNEVHQGQAPKMKADTDKKYE